MWDIELFAEDEELFDNDDVYDERVREELVDSDAIGADEDGFIRGFENPELEDVETDEHAT
ncbi:MAG: hypothetical protein KJ709_07670 [Nanoarchaeota archaeon]|nr:hypothetical protein [Nanoarchaeota archaeon]